MKTTITLLLTIILFSCNQRINKDTNQFKSSDKHTKTEIINSEDFKTLISDEINQRLDETRRELTAAEVMRLYYPYQVETKEGKESIEINEKKNKDDHTVVTLIHDNLLDDSQKAVKYVMTMKKTNNKWTVVSIKTNWKCWPNRGHTEWGTDRCR